MLIQLIQRRKLLEIEAKEASEISVVFAILKLQRENYHLPESVFVNEELKHEVLLPCF